MVSLFQPVFPPGWVVHHHHAVPMLLETIDCVLPELLVAPSHRLARQVEMAASTKASHRASGKGSSSWTPAGITGLVSRG